MQLLQISQAQLPLELSHLLGIETTTEHKRGEELISKRATTYDLYKLIKAHGRGTYTLARI